MSRLIDADALRLDTICNMPQGMVRDSYLALVDNAPTIEAVPVVHGYNNNQNYHEVDEFRCSVCGLHLEDWDRHVYDEEFDDEFIKEYVFKYCPECGAKIGGAEWVK